MVLHLAAVNTVILAFAPHYCTSRRTSVARLQVRCYAGTATRAVAAGSSSLASTVRAPRAPNDVRID